MKHIKMFSLIAIINSILVTTITAQENPKNLSNETLQLGINESYNQIKKGVRLLLSYDHQVSMFVGTAKNVTDDILESVSIKIILSNGESLGPRIISDFAAGEEKALQFKDEGKMFNWWMAHATTGGRTSSTVEAESRSERLYNDTSLENNSAQQSTGAINKLEQSTDDVKRIDQSKDAVNKIEQSTESINDAEQSKDPVNKIEQSTDDIK